MGEVKNGLSEGSETLDHALPGGMSEPDAEDPGTTSVGGADPAMEFSEPLAASHEAPVPDLVPGVHAQGPEASDEIKVMLQQKEEELQQEHERLLRVSAEYENYKKRMAREKATIVRLGNESLLKELLPILDNLERSLTHAAQAQDQGAIIEGIEMIRRELLRKLEIFGLKPICAQGEEFDPTMHEAISQIASADHPENSIIAEVQKGYFMHDRLLRPSRVVVATSPQPQEN
jgi:molecular chaperone GrpE